MKNSIKKNNPTIMLIARGPSHLRYFRKLRDNTEFRIYVKKAHHAGIKGFLNLSVTKNLNMDKVLSLDFQKLEIRMPWILKTPLWPFYKWLRKNLERLFIAKY